jgi:hypothetical protein
MKNLELEKIGLVSGRTALIAEGKTHDLRLQFYQEKAGIGSRALFSCGMLPRARRGGTGTLHKMLFSTATPSQ